MWEFLQYFLHFNNVFFFYYLENRKYTQHEKELRQRIENEILQSKLNVSFKDVIGLENVKQALTEAVILPSQRPDIFVGPRAPPRGIQKQHIYDFVNFYPVLSYESAI